MSTHAYYHTKHNIYFKSYDYNANDELIQWAKCNGNLALKCHNKMICVMTNVMDSLHVYVDSIRLNIIYL